MNSILLIAALLTSRPVFIGDSITHQGKYIGYVQLYQALREPAAVACVVNSGCAGDSGLNIIWRWNEIATTEATEYFMMLGMNDFGMRDYTTASPDEKEVARRAKLLREFDEFNREIYPKLKALGKPVTLITPSPYDVYSGANPPYVGLNEIGLAAISDHERASAKEYGFRLIDLHRPLSDFLRQQPNAIRFSGGDRIHPSEEGALLMAVEILEQLGYAKTCNEGLRVAAKDGAVDVTYAPKSLPFPDVAGWSKLLSLRPQTAALNREPLVVTGLKPGRYTVAADGREIGSFTAEELAHGINLAECDTPSRRQAAAAAKSQMALRNIDNFLRRIVMTEYYYCKDRKEETVRAWLAKLEAAEKRNEYAIGLAKDWLKRHDEVPAMKAKREEGFQRFVDAVQPKPWHLTITAK